MTWTSIKPAEQRSLGDAVYNALERLIRSGELRTGQKLAPEQELCARFDVSRPVVRAALKRLREQGLITSRKGSGSFVSLEIRQEEQLQEEASKLKQMIFALEYRRCFEPIAARFAALRRGPQEMATLEAALNDFKNSGNGSMRRNVDIRFHKALAAASLNDHFTRALDLISYDIDLGITLAFHLNSIGFEGRLHAIFNEHQAIVNAVRDQRPDAAEAAMNLHLDYSLARVLARGEAMSTAQS